MLKQGVVTEEGRSTPNLDTPGVVVKKYCAPIVKKITYKNPKKGVDNIGDWCYNKDSRKAMTFLGRPPTKRGLTVDKDTWWMRPKNGRELKFFQTKNFFFCPKGIDKRGVLCYTKDKEKRR